MITVKRCERFICFCSIQTNQSKLLTFKNQPINHYWMAHLEIINNSFSERKKNFSRLIKRKKFYSKKIKIWNYTSTRFCSEQHLGKWMHFQISLSLWELQVIKNLLCVRDIAGISSNRLLQLLIKFHLKPTVLKFLF